MDEKISLFLIFLVVFFDYVDCRMHTATTRNNTCDNTNSIYSTNSCDPHEPNSCDHHERNETGSRNEVNEIKQEVSSKMNETNQEVATRVNETKQEVSNLTIKTS